MIAMEPQFPYRRIANDLRDRIEAGEFSANEGKLPTRAKLAEDYGVSDMTIGHAIDVLKDEGRVIGVKGLGVFVAEQRRPEA